MANSQRYQRSSTIRMQQGVIKNVCLMPKPFFRNKKHHSTDFYVWITKRTGKMRRFFWSLCAYCFRNSFLRKCMFTMLIFEFFSFQLFSSLKFVVFHVFWCSEAPGTFLEWFWINLGSIIFSTFSSNFLVHYDDKGPYLKLAGNNRSEVWDVESASK